MNQDIFVLIEHLKGQVMDISYIALAQAVEVAKSTGGKVIAILMGNDVETLAGDLGANEVWVINDERLSQYNPDAYINVATALVEEHFPRMVLFGDTTIGSEVSGVLSLRLNLPLISSCQSINTDDGLKYTCQICGGKIMAQGELPEETSLIAMLPGAFKVDQGKSDNAEIKAIPCPDMGELRTVLVKYIEPSDEDVDITTESLLIGVGRGVENEDNMEVVEELADALGGTLCASRPVVDQAWLPTTRLVGKSGKTISPKLYLALGISGAPEHSEGVLGSDLIVAVNTDENAPIFNLAQYGVQGDLVDIAEALTEKIQEAKGG